MTKNSDQEKVIKQSVVWAVELANELKKDLQDKKIQFWEGFALGNNAWEGAILVSKYEKFPADWDKLSKDENYLSEVIKAVESLDIDNDKAKRLTTQIVKAGVEIGKVFQIAFEK